MSGLLLSHEHIHTTITGAIDADAIVQAPQELPVAVGRMKMAAWLQAFAEHKERT